MADFDTYLVDLDTPQPGGRSGESPRAAFTKYNDFVNEISDYLTLLELNSGIFKNTSSDANSSATLMASQLKGGIIISEPDDDIVLVLPSGSNLDSSFTQTVEINGTFEFCLINVSNLKSVDLSENSGISVIGNSLISPTSSASFKVRKTAANTFIVYRSS